MLRRRKENNMKRFVTVLLALSIILSCGITAIAADDPANQESQVGTAKVIAIEAPASIAYLFPGDVVNAAESDLIPKEYLEVKTNDATGMCDRRWITFFRVTGNSQVKYERLEVFSKMFKMGEKVEVVKYNDEFTLVNVDGKEAEIESRFLLRDGEKPYESWTGYSKRNAVVYDNPWLRGAPSVKLNKNTELKVLADMKNCYLVEQSDGEMGYVPTDYVLKEPENKNWQTETPGAAAGPEWSYFVQ